jgi:hypothetical protein
VTADFGGRRSEYRRHHQNALRMLAVRRRYQFLVIDYWSVIRPDWGLTWPSSTRANLHGVARE